jgi:hypothetical protein
MNEQLIKELLVKAGVYDCEPNDPDFKFSDVGEEYLKFAELIVRECIAQAVKEEERYDSMAGRDCEYCSMAMANFQGVLAEHFGVEE